MKTTNQFKRGPLPNTGKCSFFNVTLITDKGRPVSTQVRSDNGDPSKANEFIAKQVRRGLDEADTWDDPVLRCFVHLTATGETYELAMTDEQKQQEAEHAALVAVAEAAAQVRKSFPADRTTQEDELVQALTKLAAVRSGKAVAS